MHYLRCLITVHASMRCVIICVAMKQLRRWSCRTSISRLTEACVEFQRVATGWISASGHPPHYPLGGLPQRHAVRNHEISSVASFVASMNSGGLAFR